MSAIWFLKCLWCQHWHCDLTCMGIFGLTHWDRDKIDAILQTTFSNGFSWMKMYEFRLTFHRSGPRGPINNIPTLVQIMAWRRPGDKPLSEPMMVRSPTHICVTRPQWVKLDGVLLIFRYITERDHYHEDSLKITIGRIPMVTIAVLLKRKTAIIIVTVVRI